MSRFLGPPLLVVFAKVVQLGHDVDRFKIGTLFDADDSLSLVFVIISLL